MCLERSIDLQNLPRFAYTSPDLVILYHLIPWICNMLQVPCKSLGAISTQGEAQRLGSRNSKIRLPPSFGNQPKPQLEKRVHVPMSFKRKLQLEKFGFTSWGGCHSICQGKPNNTLPTSRVQTDLQNGLQVEPFALESLPPLPPTQIAQQKPHTHTAISWPKPGVPKKNRLSDSPKSVYTKI